MPTSRKTTSTAKPAARKAKATTAKPAARKAPAKAAPAPKAATNGPATRLPNAYIATVVKAAREQAGLSTGELAERMSTSDGAVRRIEDGRANCTVATLANVAQALGAELHISFA